jgi:hypothetical protein
VRRDTVRFEERVGIELTCCKQPMELGGNLALRGAGSPVTQLGYECKKCYRRVMVQDAWPGPGDTIYDNDEVE